ncbi:MAG: 30S ribosome-binding factor RbfA [Erysipelotrichaceae bacterium]|nr:30S ribosome-binding factor RbfA [Erysipelotrichaceae bacterium]
MPKTYKADRISNMVQKYVSEIIQFELKDKDIGFVTVTRAKVTNDYSYAYIYVSYIDEVSKQKGLEALEKAKGFIRSRLADKLTIYKTPEIIFKLDTSFDEAQEIEEVLKNLKK